MPTCQSKDGCDKEATYRVVAKLGLDTYTRLLCDDHAFDAVHSTGQTYLSQMVKKAHGYVRRAHVYPYQRGTLFVNVKEASHLKVGDGLLVMFFMQMSDLAMRTTTQATYWGVAPVLTMREGNYFGNTTALLPLPEGWKSVVASVEATLLSLKHAGRT